MRTTGSKMNWMMDTTMLKITSHSSSTTARPLREDSVQVPSQRCGFIQATYRPTHLLTSWPLTWPDDVITISTGSLGMKYGDGNQ